MVGGREYSQDFTIEILSFCVYREDLLIRSDPNNEQFLSTFVILAAHYLVGGLARGLFTFLLANP